MTGGGANVGLDVVLHRGQRVPKEEGEGAGHTEVGLARFTVLWPPCTSAELNPEAGLTLAIGQSVALRACASVKVKRSIR